MLCVVVVGGEGGLRGGCNVEDENVVDDDCGGVDVAVEERHCSGGGDRGKGGAPGVISTCDDDGDVEVGVPVRPSFINLPGLPGCIVCIIIGKI